jgi:membrane-associated phospholipid phosphatase
MFFFAADGRPAPGVVYNREARTRTIFTTKKLMKSPAIVVAVLVMSVRTLAAQQIELPPASESRPIAQSMASLGGVEAGQPLATTSLPVTPRPPSASFFKTVGQDFKGFFTLDTAKFVGVFAVAGASASNWDKATVRDANEHMPSDVSRVGNAAGTFAVQAGAGAATYLIGRVSDQPRVASLGGDVVRAQLLSQLFVQVTKRTVGRDRPDASNSLSFPSGHSASAFATATVLQQHLGWKGGLPAYAFAGFVGASRIASSKHYLSDVLIGAGVGIAAGRTVTLHLGREKFALGAAPTRGGAMVTFTKQ